MQQITEHYLDAQRYYLATQMAQQGQEERVEDTPGNPTRLLVMVGLEHTPGVNRSGTMAFRQIVLHIEMTLYVAGRKHRGITVRMEARDRGQNKEDLRHELIQYTSINLDFHADGVDVSGPVDYDHMTVEIIDPTGILKWLGIDLVEQFKKSHNDKPLRLPSETIRPGRG